MILLLPRMTNNSSQLSQSRRRSSLTALQPIDAAPFKRPSGLVFIWGTILLVWLISLLPWRMWALAPDVLLLVITFWCLHEPRHVSMLAAFIFGLLMDVHDVGLLGAQALTYTLAAYGTLLLSRRILRFNVIVQTVHLIPVFVISSAAAQLPLAWLVGEWEGWVWLWSALFTVALWPLVDVLLLMPQRRLDDADASSV